MKRKLILAAGLIATLSACGGGGPNTGESPFPVPAPSPAPVTVNPHLIALIYCPSTEPGSGIFEVVFRRGLDEESEQVARNVSTFSVEPGKFMYRLVQAELEFPEYGQVFAHCRVDRGPWTVVPFTLLAPADQIGRAHV